MKIDWALFRFPFDDPRWKGKFAIGGLLMLIATFLSVPFFWLAWPAQGYSLQIMRRTLKGEPPALPEWDGWGKLFGDGLKAFVVQFVYFLPVTLFACGLYAAWFVAVFGMTAVAGGSRGFANDAAGPLMGGIFLVYGLSFVAVGIIFILSIPLSFLAMVAVTRLAATENLGSAFEFGEVWRLARAGFKNYALAYLIFFAAIIGASVAASMLMYTIILACLYPFAIAVALIYGQAMLGALFGMAHYHTTNPGAADQGAGAPKPLPPPKDRADSTQASDSTPPAEMPSQTPAAKRAPGTTARIASERKWTDKDTDSMDDFPTTKPIMERPPDTRKTMTGRRTPAPGKVDTPKKKDE